MVILTKLIVGISWADVVECAHKTFQNETNTHCLVNTVELWETM